MLQRSGFIPRLYVILGHSGYFELSITNSDILILTMSIMGSLTLTIRDMCCDILLNCVIAKDPTADFGGKN